MLELPLDHGVVRPSLSPWVETCWDPAHLRLSGWPTLAVECLLQRVSCFACLLLLVHLRAANGLFGAHLNEILFDIGVVLPRPVRKAIGIIWYMCCLLALK